MNNLESRIYAQLSKQLADQMFAEGGATQGSMEFQGNMISWVNNGTDVTLTITQPDGTQTVVTVPIGTFGF
jgi:23S rRNA pseudoU1915 N3-methylase RlmH